MLRTLDLTASHESDWRAVVPRAEFDVAGAVERVAPILKDVESEGVAALQRYSQRFDQVVPDSFRVPAEDLERCAAQVDDDLRAAFVEAIRRRRQVAETLEREAAFTQVEVAPGAIVGHRVVPVNRVGLYVPGGLAPLASSVLMNVVPAQVAGVGSIAVASPPQRDFDALPHPSILALCHLLGVEEVYAVGGAQAIAMFAYGVPDLCPRVDMVTGPGNIYVVAAKRLLRGTVGIDSEAGPTEIAVLADETAVPAYVAADLISQAEHDPMAGAVLVTDSRDLAAAVNEEVERQAATTKHSDRVRMALTGTQSAIVLVRDLDQGIEVVNAYGPEHLEIHTHDATARAAQVTNAGAVFVGPWSPVSVGDYVAGSTHVLPTGGAAAHSSGLTVRSFCKAMHVIDYSQPALMQIADAVETFAQAEELPAHARAVEIRRTS